MDTYKLIIGCNLNQYETNTFEPNTYLALDIMGDRTITANAHLASQPMQTGDTITDHMYREPVRYNVSGAFGINSKHWENDFYTEYDKGDRLTNVETIFEKIKNEGILCTLTFIQTDDDNGVNPPTDGTSTRFITRKNMALSGITWTEQLNTVRFAFTFTEIIMVDNQEIYNPSDDVLSQYALPNITAPKGATLGQLMADNQDLEVLIVRQLDSAGYISDNFKKEIQDNITREGGKAVGISVAISVVGGIMIAAGVIKLTVATTATISIASTVMTATITGGASAGPVGLIIAGAAIVIAGLCFGIAKIIQAEKQKTKYRQGFDKLKDVEKLEKILTTARNTMRKVDSGVTLYEFAFNEEQQCLIKLGTEIYCVETVRNNTSNDEWIFKVTGINCKLIHYNPNPMVITDLSCIDNNMSAWFTNKEGDYIAYLYNPSLNDDINDTDEKIQNVRKNLTSYYVLVSNGSAEENMSYFYRKLQTTLVEEGFTDVK